MAQWKGNQLKLPLITSFFAFLLLFPLLVLGDQIFSSCTGDIEEQKHLESCTPASLFVRVDNDLHNTKYGHEEVPFPFSKTIEKLPIPDFVRVFETNGDTESYSLDDLAKSARKVVDDNLSSSGAVLFRNLHHKIENASDFKDFWNGVMESDQKGNWTYHQFLGYSNYPPRTRLAGVDTASNNPPHILLGPHNEMVYEPKVPSKVAFHCLCEGIGGETLLAINKEITEKIPNYVKNFIKSHGGIHYFAYYFSDAESEEPNALSWQGKTGATTREDAIQFFVDRGWKEEDISFDHRDEMKVSFVHPGYIVDDETGEEIWFNVQINTDWPMADGTKMTKAINDGHTKAAWQSTYSFQLQKGDWLVLDNKRVMHGRLPYKDISRETPRTLLVVYTE